MIRASLLLSWWLLALAQAAVWDLELCRSRESHWVGGAWWRMVVMVMMMVMVVMMMIMMMMMVMVAIMMFVMMIMMIMMIITIIVINFG